MRASVLLVCVAACLAPAGCGDRWEWKWPDQLAADRADKTKTPTSRPAGPGVTPQQEIAQLQRQIKTLRERLEVIENENAELHKTNKDVKELRKALEQQTFTTKMQAEDLKILRTAAVERDLYKTRVEHLQQEVQDLTTRIVNLMKKPSAGGVGADRRKATTKPADP